MCDSADLVWLPHVRNVCPLVSCCRRPSSPSTCPSPPTSPPCRPPSSTSSSNPRSWTRTEESPPLPLPQSSSPLFLATLSEDRWAASAPSRGCVLWTSSGTASASRGPRRARRWRLRTRPSTIPPSSPCSPKLEARTRPIPAGTSLSRTPATSTTTAARGVTWRTGPTGGAAGTPGAGPSCLLSGSCLSTWTAAFRCVSWWGLAAWTRRSCRPSPADCPRLCPRTWAPSPPAPPSPLPPSRRCPSTSASASRSRDPAPRDRRHSERRATETRTRRCPRGPEPAARSGPRTPRRAGGPAPQREERPTRRRGTRRSLQTWARPAGSGPSCSGCLPSRWNWRKIWTGQCLGNFFLRDPTAKPSGLRQREEWW